MAPLAEAAMQASSQTIYKMRYWNKLRMLRGKRTGEKVSAGHSKM